MDWQGKVALVTGAAVGIGAATAEHFAAKGAKAVLTDVNQAAGDEVVRRIKAAGGEAIFVKGDISADKEVQALADATLRAFGRIDALVNNAGIMVRHPFEEWGMAEIRRIIDINLTAVFLTTHMLAPIMAKTGGGAIVNVSSLGGLMPVPYCPAYAATKAGVLGLTRSFASALPQGVRVTAMLPDFVDTPMTANAPLRGKVPILAPMDLARGIVHVASDASAKGAFYSVRSSENGPVLLRVPDEPQFLPAETTPF